MKIQLTERGLVTFTALVVCFTLLMSGKDDVVGYSLLAVVIGYFGIEVWPIPQIRQRRKEE